MLREITSTLNTLVKRVESTESGLKKVQDKLQQSCSSRSSSGESFKAKDDVPLVIRVSFLTVRMYFLFAKHLSTRHIPQRILQTHVVCMYVCGTLEECSYYFTHYVQTYMLTCSSVMILTNFTAPQQALCSVRLYAVYTYG